MTLTKDERYTAYCIMLEEAESGEYLSVGLCRLMYEVFDSIKYYNYAVLKEEFPELALKRPSKASIMWFPSGQSGWDSRIAIIKQCIEETSNF